MDKPLTPQQEKFLTAFLDPASPTWSNYYKSALAAGYKEEYAQNISHLMPEWLSESIGDNALIKKALVNLQEFLEGESEDLRWKSTNLVLKGLMKDKFSERSEVTGKNGQPVVFQIANDISDKQSTNTDTSTESGS